MGLFSSIFTLPLAPVRGVIRLGELLRDEAERKLRDPTVARRELEQIEAAQAAGELTEEEASEAMNAVLQRMMPQESEGE
ncbi:gas vesicle protein G [Herbidospora galbida]|uniref:Gas vesicle protein G n=1 Tax=Herbidospora galbida TaxID=2575442 RepID=A0A4U3MGQ8_9ACTN|nr:gas vesicle protein GvpG [Herbidospora galbida]TKK87779.1 gas vesicle protein G [Herbidospora galbida]